MIETLASAAGERFKQAANYPVIGKKITTTYTKRATKSRSEMLIVEESGYQIRTWELVPLVIVGGLAAAWMIGAFDNVAGTQKKEKDIFFNPVIDLLGGGD